MKTRRHKEAIADFETLLPFSQYEECALVALGDSYTELGEYELAIEHYSKIVGPAKSTSLQTDEFQTGPYPMFYRHSPHIDRKHP
jgi:hypothetical protein